MTNVVREITKVVGMADSLAYRLDDCIDRLRDADRARAHAYTKWQIALRFDQPKEEKRWAIALDTQNERVRHLEETRLELMRELIAMEREKMA